MKQQFLYLHGFASGPQSTKAKFFTEKFSALGIDLLIPNLNKPSFENMTLSTQLQVIQDVMKNDAKVKSTVIIGSSMGGLLAVLFAQDHPYIDALVLLAPAFDLGRRWLSLLGEDGLENWRKGGSLPIYHYEMKKDLPLQYHFIEDVQQWQKKDLKIAIPTLVLHGIGDETVPIATSYDFRDKYKELVELIAIDDDHQLIGSLDLLWTKTEEFLHKHELLSTAYSNCKTDQAEATT